MRMKVHVEGFGRDGEPFEADVDIPSTLRVGDTFVVGLEGEQEEVEILGMERAKGSDGALATTVIVGPLPEYGWTRAEG
jgi:hypothetical protein